VWLVSDGKSADDDNKDDGMESLEGVTGFRDPDITDDVCTAVDPANRPTDIPEDEEVQPMSAR
jgi:hypothetical protein